MPNRPEIRHGSSLNPAYSPLFDEVQMPLAGQFESPNNYYAALFHELTHSTGHASRLGRLNSDKEGTTKIERYSHEELVAELGAAFLCASSGLDNDQALEDSSGYIAGWLSALRNDRMLLLLAASAAQKATDFILGVAAEETPEVALAA